MSDAQTSIQNPRMADFVIITALPEERDAMLRKLLGYHRLPPTEHDVRVYYSADVTTNFPDSTTSVYSVVVLCLLDMGRVEAANATNDAIRRWNPRYVLMVGIAGGVSHQGIMLGDVLISNQVVDYELQKLTPDGPKVRYNVHRADPRLFGAAMSLANDWQGLIEHRRPKNGLSRRFHGPVATGDKVIAVEDVLSELHQDWPKLIGVEMEAGGVASAAFQSASQPGFFMVRGVSDLADANKDSTGTNDWRDYACDAAASFTIMLLRNGPVPEIVSLKHNNKEILSSAGITNLLDTAERLREAMVSRATGIFSDSEEYTRLRRQLMTIPRVRAVLPEFVRNSRTLDEFWAFIKPLFQSYQERRAFIREKFNDVLSLLEEETFSEIT